MSYIYESYSSDEASESVKGGTPVITGSWSLQGRALYLSMLFVLLGCVANGWALGGPGGTLTMPAFQQHFKWQINCVQTSETVASSTLGTCRERYPSGILIEDEICIECCCDPNPDINIPISSGLIGSLGLWGSALGSLSIGPCADILGRRSANIIGTLFTILGSSMSAFASNLTQLYFGRFISGMAIGQLVTAAPMYLSELAPAPKRGFMGNISQMGLIIGMAIVGLFNVYAPNIINGWRMSYGGALLFSSSSFIGLVMLPESPRWLYMNNRETQGARSLQKLRDDPTEYLAEKTEYDAMYINMAKTSVWNPKNVKHGLFSRPLYWRTLSMFAFHLLQQMSGVNAIGFFVPVIYNQFYSATQAAWGYVGLVMFKVVALSMGMTLIDTKGRKKLLYIGGIIMASSLFALTLFTLPYNHDGAPSTQYPEGDPPYLTQESLGLAIVISVWVFMFGFSFSWGGIPFLMTAEYIDANHRSLGMSLCGGISWTTAGLLALIFPSMLEGMDLWGTALFYCVFTVLGVVFVKLCLMETNHLSMEALDEALLKFKAENKVLSKFR